MHKNEVVVLTVTARKLSSLMVAHAVHTASNCSSMCTSATDSPARLNASIALLSSAHIRRRKSFARLESVNYVVIFDTAHWLNASHENLPHTHS